MKVFVYFNIRTKVWSIKALEGQEKGRVIAHATNLYLDDATFKVSEAGRQRVLRERRKNVHAGVIGQWDRSKIRVDLLEHTQVSYNPYRSGNFVVKGTEIPVHVAKRVKFDGRNVSMLN